MRTEIVRLYTFLLLWFSGVAVLLHAVSVLAPRHVAAAALPRPAMAVSQAQLESSDLLCEDVVKRTETLHLLGDSPRMQELALPVRRGLGHSSAAPTRDQISRAVSGSTLLTLCAVFVPRKLPPPTTESDSPLS